MRGGREEAVAIAMVAIAMVANCISAWWAMPCGGSEWETGLGKCTEPLSRMGGCGATCYVLRWE